MKTSTEHLLAALVPVIQGLEDAAASDRAWLASAEAPSRLDPAAWTVAEAARNLFVRLRAGDTTAVPVILGVADVLETRLGADPAVDAVIDDVLVHYPSPGEEHDDVTRALGPGLRAALDAQRDVRLPPAVEAFVDGLLRAVPVLHPLADETRYGYHRVVLPHVFLGEVVRRETALLTGGASLGLPPACADGVAGAVENGKVAELERLYLAGAADPAAEVRAVLDHVEAALGADDEVDELVRVSFVENLPYRGESGEEIIGLLGPRLTAALRESRGVRG
jgi:hypothetical protein